MKITCTKENLNQALSHVSRIVNPRASLPVLSNILIKTEKGRIRISSTDLEIGINIWIGGKVEKDGAITVPARVISEFVSNCDDKNITLSTEKNQLQISSEKYNASIAGIDADEFPLIPEIKEDPIVKISTKVLLEAIPQVLPAVSLDESRPVLSGVFWQFTENKSIIAATDSYRLAEKVLACEQSKKADSIIVPYKTMMELEKTAVITSENISISVSENQARFMIGKNAEIVSRLIEGNYPDYKQILPKAFKITCITDKNEIVNALKMSNLFAREVANNVSISFKSKEIELRAEAAQMGNIDSKIVSKNTGTDVKSAFNVKFFLDGLGAVNTDSVKIEVSGELTPTKISDPKMSDYFYVIMPLRTE